MAKKIARYVCSNCGNVSSSWAGKCSVCGEWNTIEQEAELVSGAQSKTSAGKTIETVDLKKALGGKDAARLKTGLSDVDLVLGGGFVPGSLTLIAGQPGIGKSTLLMQVAAHLAKSQSVLYVSGEESARQVADRATRLGADASKLRLASSVSAEDVAATIVKENYDVVFVDSIQTMTVSGVASTAGSVSQITNSTHVLMSAAKQNNTAVIMVGHVTKEGSIAGPKVLEHIVDVVLNLEGDRYGGFKVLRSIKNRYGSTNEAGIFEMEESGLIQVDNPSASLLEERQASDGSVVLATMEGSRPLLVEVQALVNKTSYGYPKRAASGIDLNRVNLLVAMLEKRTKLFLSEYDIYINIVGGIRITEPAADLAVCMAIGSAAKGMELKGNAVVFGEVGLSGEVRRVNFAEKRLKEAEKLGFDTAIGPFGAGPKGKTILSQVRDVRSALNNHLKSKKDN
jgi:DNA repair protein RadA/Sms